MSYESQHIPTPYQVAAGSFPNEPFDQTKFKPGVLSHTGNADSFILSDTGLNSRTLHIIQQVFQVSLEYKPGPIVMCL